MDDGRAPSKFEWIDATSGSPDPVPGLNYTALEGVINTWYQNQTAQSVLRTRAILVVHQVTPLRSPCPLAVQMYASPRSVSC